MKKPGQNNNLDSEISYNRRSFIGKSLAVTLISSISSSALLTACKEEEGNEVTPTEDLMQEHGLLNRILLVYDHCKDKFSVNELCDHQLIHNSAGIIRSFVEDYHEKQEENYLFPRMEKAGQLTKLVETLRIQHIVGRNITDKILNVTKAKTLSESDTQELIQLLSDFNTMYRPHETREDTVLFPAFRKIVSKHEYDSLGEEFENNEHKLFGSDGFEKIVSQVETIEKSLGIYDLSKFTPKND